MGYVFQGVGLFPHLSVADNIGITPNLWDAPASYGAGRRTARLGAARTRGLRDACRTNCPAASASASAWRGAGGPAAIVLMDEPFGALDPLTRDALGDDFARCTKLGLTTVMITHDMTEAILLADRVAVMRAGKLLAEGTPSELSESSDAYVGEFLRTPRRQAERLNALLPRDGAA